MQVFDKHLTWTYELALIKKIADSVKKLAGEIEAGAPY
jgi:hypothetical protein